LLEKKKKEDERGMEDARFLYTPRKRRWARARALPDAGGCGFRMQQACRLVVYFYSQGSSVLIPESKIVMLVYEGAA
jgi:hypothetical protein